MKRSFVFITILLPTLVTLLAPVSAFAEIQVVVEDNGESTSNEVAVSNTQTTDVSQTNTASVQNNITQYLDTGNNTANGNSDDVTITSGDISSGTTLTNSLNTSEVHVDCCNGDTSLTISTNGAHSNNSIVSTSNVMTTIGINQNADIDNDVRIYGNTGRNEANYNGGNVSISTGNITGWLDMINAANNASVSVGNGVGDISVLLENNGARSSNEVVLSLLGGVNIWKNQLATVDNDIYADLNTGLNETSFNLGDVFLKTGNVDYVIDVTNGPINTSEVEVLCCDDGAPVEPEQPHNPAPVTPPSSSGSAPGSSIGGSNVGGVLAAVADVLPSTGASALHFWIMSVVYLLTFLSGLYLRLRAGRSPDYARLSHLAH